MHRKHRQILLVSKRRFTVYTVHVCVYYECVYNQLSIVQWWCNQEKKSISRDNILYELYNPVLDSNDILAEYMMGFFCDTLRNIYKYRDNQIM